MIDQSRTVNQSTFYFKTTFPAQPLPSLLKYPVVLTLVQVIDAHKRDIVSIYRTQGALSSDWLGQPPLTCPWPIRGECAYCVSFVPLMHN